MGSTVVNTFCERNYRIYTPSGIPSSAPLVLSLHPGTSNALFWESGVHGLNGTLDTAADSGLFYAVYPNGGFPPGSTSGTWNAGWCCDWSIEIRQDDVNFLKKLIAQLQIDYSINPAKIYLSGYSNGAFMCYRYINTYPSDIAGMVVAAGSLVINHFETVDAVTTKYIHVYGSDDTNVPPAGGYGAGVSGSYFPPLAQTTAYMQSKGATPTITELIGATHDFSTIQSVLASQEGTSFAQIIANMVAA